MPVSVDIVAFYVQNKGMRNENESEINEMQSAALSNVAVAGGYRTGRTSSSERRSF
jgi:hypothetical protein